LKTYVISLKSREDRRLKLINDPNFRELDSVFVEAISIQDDFDFLHPNKAHAACWLSHHKVAHELLKSGDPYALVLEDDAELSKALVRVVNEISINGMDGIDCLQLGFNVFNGRITGRRFLAINRMWWFLLFLVSRLVRFRGHKSLPMCRFNKLLVPKSFETGSHCYILSRKLALTLTNFNNPPVIPADVALSELALSNNLSFYRVTKPLSPQSDSASSINTFVTRANI
jgi:GR25 family glycosyltransferase involved in LPS biosynthesis